MIASRRIGILWLALSLGVARADTLDPGHPVWQHAAVDAASLVRCHREVRAARPKGGLQSEQAAKGYASYRQRILVIPVYYADRSRPTSPSREQLALRSFAGPSSLRGYWEVASGGQFVPEGQVLDWVRLPQTLARYRNIEDGAAVGNPLAGPREMVRDALRAIAPAVDLHQFDDDGPDGIPGSGDDDGFVDLLLLLHLDAGFENDFESLGPSMLAHASYVSPDAELLADGVVGGSYAIASAQGPLGVWAHEMGHLLGLDDLYDLSLALPPDTESPRGGLGLWSLMSHGTWGAGGTKPSALDAYSRRQLGWDTSPAIDDIATVSLQVAGTGNNQSLRLDAAGDWQGEHFLFERRVRNHDGVVDGDLPGDGVLVYQVDPGRPIRADADGAAVRLLQADGRDDLGELQNNGDADDAFTALVELDSNSQPALQSNRPDASRISPRVTIAASAGGAQSVHVEASEVAQLQLVQADFADVAGRRTFLLPGESAEWSLRFTSLGPGPSSAELDLIFLDPRLELANSFPVSLLASGSSWQPVTALQLSELSLSTQAMAPEVEFELRVDGLARRIRLGVPVGSVAGLLGDDFYLWQPEILAAGADSTRWALLGLGDLPGSTSSGWELQTDGVPGYANGADLTLTSPWFAAAPLDPLEFWSDAMTESAQPGEAYDGGVLELQQPGGSWVALPPQGTTTWIRAVSEASTRASIGLGGRATGWQSYRAILPPLSTPLRLRLRFGSDASFRSGHWGIAGLGSRQSALEAELEFERGPLGQLLLRAELSGDGSTLTNHEVQPRWRTPAGSSWTDAAASQRYSPSDVSFVFELELPDTDVLTIGLFVEDAGDPDSASQLLGSAGYAPGGVLRLSLLANPARGEATILLNHSGRSDALHVYDLRGRLVRSLPFLASARRVHWDGKDAGGRSVASGRYFVLLDSDPAQRVALSFLR